MANRVLVVDDDPAIARTLAAELGPGPVSVVIAADATTAIRLLDEEHFCGLVLDLVLAQGGNGFDVLRHVTESQPALPTVIVSSKLPEYVRDMLDDRHVKLVLPKPVDPRLLALVVLGLCGVTV